MILGLAADVGTLQRLPKITGNDSLARELAVDGREFSAQEAKSLGLVSRIFDSQKDLLDGAFEIARQIASKSPLAIQETKLTLNYCRDHSVHDGLEYSQVWGAMSHQADDLMGGFRALAEKKQPQFKDL